MNYHADSVPALKTESFVTAMRDHISRIGFELTSITVPGQVYREFTNTWPQLIKGLKDDENFGGFINRKSYIKDTCQINSKGKYQPGYDLKADI